MCHYRGCFFHFLTIAILIPGIAVSLQAQVPKIKASDLVINGESFFAASNIKSELEKLARADGVIGQNDTFSQIAVSGANISKIVGFYRNCNPKPVYLISDGGGIDLMNGNCTDENCTVIKNCKNTLLQYIDEMKKGGTKKLLWMIYPDPQGSQWATLKKNQDIWAKVVPQVMATVTEPKVTLVDLRKTWEGHYSQYTSDGIHCTSAGGAATAKAFWDAMKADNYAFFDTGKTATYDGQLNVATLSPSMLLGQIVGNGRISLSLSLDQPSNIILRLMTASGRKVITMERKAAFSGIQTVEFPLGAISPGIYCYEIKAGGLTTQSTLVVQQK